MDSKWYLFCCCWVPFILSLAHRGVIWQEFHFWFPPVECGFFWREMQMKFRWTSSANPGWFYKARGRTPGAPLTYFNDGGVRQRFIFYTQKNPSVSLHQQILLFTFWKAKTCQLQLWFFNLVKNKTINCAYVIVDLSWWKIQYPQKSLCCFRDPKKSRRLS